MTKIKAGIITAITGLLLFCVIYLSASYDYRWYKVLMTIFSYYGCVQALVIFYRFLREPSTEPRHAEIVVASGKTIPKGWIDPYKLVKTKEDDNGSTVNTRAASDRLSNARNNESGTEPVSGGTVETVRSGDGSRETEPIFKNSAAARGSESAALG